MRVHVAFHLLTIEKVLLAHGTLDEPLALLTQPMLYLHVPHEGLVEIGGHYAVGRVEQVAAQRTALVAKDFVAYKANFEFFFVRLVGDYRAYEWTQLLVSLQVVRI